MHLAPPPPPPGFREPERAERPGARESTRIWLIRHGRVAEPAVAYGNSDVALSPAGEAQTESVAKRLAEALATDLEERALRTIRASSLVRAHRMGEAIARRTGVSLVVDSRLVELDRGDWQGLLRTEYAERWHAQRSAYWADTLKWRGHGGESEEQLLARTWPALEEVLPGGGTVVIAAHRQVIRCLVAGALGLPPGKSHGLDLAPGHGMLLVDSPDGWRLERSNAERPGARLAGELPEGPPEDVQIDRSRLEERSG